jgi:tRNA threonylcarbamoyladenosine biosynthesis protein TsaB
MESRREVGPSAVLAIDTSTQVASVAVVGPGGGSCGEGLAGSRHDDLLELIDRALADAGVELADLAGIAVGAGPGSFTGLRIGMATAKGLCFATGLPLWSVSSLAALAFDAGEVDSLVDTLVVPAFDARRGEIGAGFFHVDAERAEPLADERILQPGQLAALVAEVLQKNALGRAVVVGDALALHPDALASAGEPLARARVTPSARSVGRLAVAGPRIDVLQTGAPVYIRPSAAEVAFPDGNPGSRLVSRRDGKRGGE